MTFKRLIEKNKTITDLNEYQAIIKTILEQGYKCVDMEQFDPNLAHLLLRHDVDINFNAAIDMAKLESSNNWQAIYFVMLSTEFYNLFSRAGRINLQTIVSLGHEIGLHYDLSVYKSNDAIQEKIQDECDVLQKLIGKEIKYVAPHRPSSYCKDILNNETLIANRIHPYQPKYFSNNRYIAESPGYWAHGHPLDNEVFKSGKGIQLLTHPHLWINKEIDRDVKIENSISQQKELLISEAKLNFDGFTLKS